MIVSPKMSSSEILSKYKETSMCIKCTVLTLDIGFLLKKELEGEESHLCPYMYMAELKIEIDKPKRET